MSPPASPHPDVSADLLVTHAGALRSVARAMLRDEHAADDVVQETWLRALVAAPNVEGGLGGWLHRVAEGFARRRRRSESRRADREREYASERPESIDVERRGAVMRAVFEAVLALDEPYRETVLLRWFEGLPPRAIAERFGVPVATVDSRLQRAHARLRTTLERELGDERDGGWRGVVALVLGTPREPAPPTFALPLIGVVVGLKSLGAALAVVVGVCLWLGLDRSQPAAPTPADLASANAPSREAATLDVAAETGGRALAADPTAAALVANAAADLGAALPPGPHAFELRVEVVDGAERPVEDAVILLGPASCALAEIGKTGRDGVMTKTWRGFEPSIEGVISVRAGGRATALRRITLEAGVRAAMRVELESETAQPFGIRLQGTLDTDGGLTMFEMQLDAPESFVVDAAGNGIFSDPSLARAEEASPEPRSATVESVLFDGSEGIELVFGAQVDIAPSAAEGETPPAILRGILRDEHGRPVASGAVSCRASSGRIKTIATDANGAFAFESIPAGRVELWAGGGLHELVHEVLELAPAEVRDLEPRLEPRPSIAVRLENAQGDPIAGWRVEARSTTGGASLGVAWTDAEGRARIGLTADVPVALFARPKDRTSAPATLVGASAHAAAEEFHVRVRESLAPGSISLSVAGEKIGGLEARAWRLDTDEGVALDDESVRFATSAGERGEIERTLLPGRWRVEVRAAGSTWTAVGECQVAAGEAFDLGLVELPRGARIALAAAVEGTPERTAFTLRTRIDGATVLWPEHDLALPATITTVPGTPFDFLSRAAGTEVPPKLVSREPKRLVVGREERIELR